MDGYEIRCLVGNDVFKGVDRIISNTAYLIVAQDEIVASEIPVVMVQPNNQKVKAGANVAQFDITAVGKNLTFVWQYRESEEDYWKNIEAAVGSLGSVSYIPLNEKTTASILRINNITYDLSGYEIRCLVGNEYYKYDNTVKSNTVDLIVVQDVIKEDIMHEEKIIDLIASSGDSMTEITLSWEHEDGLRYELYFINESGEFELLGDDVTSPYVHSGLTPNTLYPKAS
jgi:hypothetical protein